MVVRGIEKKKTSSDNGAGFSYRNSYRKLTFVFPLEVLPGGEFFCGTLTLPTAKGRGFTARSGKRTVHHSYKIAPPILCNVTNFDF